MRKIIFGLLLIISGLLANQKGIYATFNVKALKSLN